MTLKLRLLALICLAPMAACATTPEPPMAEAPPPAAKVELAADQLPPLPDNSTIGLYLAGSAAMRDGRNQEAAEYFARAAALVDSDGQPYLRERSFTAAVNAGDIKLAASMAPGPGEGSQASQRLGKLVLSVDSLAKGDGATASTLLKEDIGQPYRNASLLLRPWASILAGEDNPAGQPRLSGGDRLTLAFSQANRALALEHAKRPDDAQAAYQGLSSSGVSMRAFSMMHGAFLERQGKKAEAIAVYDALLAETPDDSSALAAKARVNSRRGVAPGLPTIQQAAAQALMMSASGSLSQGSADQALIYVQLARRLDPERTDAQMMAGGFAETAGEYAKAREIYAKVPASAPEYVDARVRLAATWRLEGELDKAVDTARETARLSPNDRGAQLDLADLLRASEDYEGAVKVLTKVISTRGREPDWRMLYARAIALENANRWPEAEKDLQRALALEPNNPEVMNYLGYIWADRGENLPQALDLLQKAARQQPNSGAIIDSLGWAYFRMGDMTKAVENLERAVELSPSDADVNDHLGDAYYKVEGRRLEALFQWERVLTLQPSDELRAKVLAKIAQEQRATNIAKVDPISARP